MERVVAEQGALRNRLDTRPVGRGHDDADGCDPRKAAQGGTRCATDFLVVEDPRIAQADGHDHACLDEPGARDPRDLAEFARGAEGLEGLLERDAHGIGQGRWAFDVLLALVGDAHDEGVDIEGGHGCGGECDARHGRRP